jgi:ribosomal protein S18 acetylase RimI-like enzyme
VVASPAATNREPARESLDAATDASHERPSPRLVKIVPARVEDAALVHRITQQAFAEYRGVLDPPSGAHDETIHDVERAIERGGALLAWDGDVLVGSARFEPTPDHLYVGRVAVHPEHRRKGIATALMARMADIARELRLPAVQVGVRDSLPSNLRLYERLGFEVVAVEPHSRGPDKTIWMARRLPAPRR